LEAEMTDSEVEAKLEALERQLERARLKKDDPYARGPVYRRIGNIGVPAVGLLLRLHEAYPEEWGYAMCELRRVAEAAKDPTLARRVLDAAVSRPNPCLSDSAIETISRLGPSVEDRTFRDRIVGALLPTALLKDSPLNYQVAAAERARKALERMGGAAARQALKEPTEEFTLRLFYRSIVSSPSWTVFVRNGLFYVVEESGQRSYIGNLDQSRTKVFTHKGQPARGKGTCVGKLTSRWEGPGIVSPNADTRWGPVDPWLVVSRGKITRREDEGDHLVSHDLGTGEGGPDELILAAALLLIKTDRGRVLL